MLPWSVELTLCVPSLASIFFFYFSSAHSHVPGSSHSGSLKWALIFLGCNSPDNQLWLHHCSLMLKKPDRIGVLHMHNHMLWTRKIYSYLRNKQNRPMQAKTRARVTHSISEICQPTRCFPANFTLDIQFLTQNLQTQYIYTFIRV